MPTIIFATCPYIETLLEGVADYARVHGWTLVTTMRRNGKFPRSARPDGIIATVAEAELAIKLKEFDCPIVTMLSTQNGALPYPRVLPDYGALGEIGGRHLLTLGRPHLVFYRRHLGADSTAVRDGFERAVRAAGRASTRIDFPEEFPEIPDASPGLTMPMEQWHAHMAKKLLAMPKPCAIMAEDDRYAIELVVLAKKLNLRVPEDVAVLGCDNVASELRLSPVPLSSVDANLDGVGFMAAQVLQQLLDGKPAPTSPVVVAPRGLASRQSTSIFVCPDARISNVVCRIRAEFQEPISVVGLARQAGMSVRALQMAFKSELGISVRDEITRCRLANVERLLEETDLKMSALAAESGLSDVGSLTRLIRQRHQVTPMALRSFLRERRRQFADLQRL